MRPISPHTRSGEPEPKEECHCVLLLLLLLLRPVLVEKNMYLQLGHSLRSVVVGLAALAEVVVAWVGQHHVLRLSPLRPRVCVHAECVVLQTIKDTKP